MPQIDTLRPSAVDRAGGWTAAPSGTLDAVTKDDLDSTWAKPATSDYMRLTMPLHVLTAGYGRHRLRARVRATASVGDTTLSFNPTLVGGGFKGTKDSTDLSTGVNTDAIGVWRDDLLYQLPQGIDLQWAVSAEDDENLTAQVLEVYLDVDTRHVPVFTPEVLDWDEENQANGTVTDTNLIRFGFGEVDYDELPPRYWRFAVYSAAAITAPGFVPFTTAPLHAGSGVGIPVNTARVLDNGDYVVFFEVASSIRGDSAHRSVIVQATLTVEATIPTGPVNVTAEISSDPPQITVCWEGPALDYWADPANVYTEIVRTDCNGTERVAALQDVPAGCFVDRFAALSGYGDSCDEEDHVCEVCYEIRYLGYVDQLPTPISETIPAGVILAWPDTAATIPAGWTRTTALDGKYVKGIATATTAPGATGGAATHTHTTPGHDHLLQHSHGVGVTTTSSTVRGAADGAGQPAIGNHNHDLPNTDVSNVRTQKSSPAAGAGTLEPAHKDVIFVSSAGTATTVPAGMVALRNASGVPAGWETEDSNGAGTVDQPPYLKGAVTDGSTALIPALTHTHAVASHSHGGTSHTHPVGDTMKSNEPEQSQQGASSGSKWASFGHHHPMSIPAATTDPTTSVAGGTTGGSGALTNDPKYRMVNFIRSVTGEQFDGLIGMWLGPLGSIPVGWRLCDGQEGTSDLINRFPRYYGPHSINAIGGGVGHTHTTPSHSHASSGSHSHAVTISATGADKFLEDGTQNRATAGHGHPGSVTNAVTPSVGASTSGTTAAVYSEPPFTGVAFIAKVGTATNLAKPMLLASESETVCVEALPNPSPGDDWLRGVEGGDIAVCPQRAWTRVRPFGAFQPIEGGTPTVVTAAEGKRDYKLEIAVTSNAAMAQLEEILAQPMVYYQPAGFGPGYDQWMSPESGASWGEAGVKQVRSVSVSFVGVEKEPTLNPAEVILAPDPTMLADQPPML